MIRKIVKLIGRATLKLKGIRTAQFLVIATGTFALGVGTAASVVRYWPHRPRTELASMFGSSPCLGWLIWEFQVRPSTVATESRAMLHLSAESRAGDADAQACVAVMFGVVPRHPGGGIYLYPPPGGHTPQHGGQAK